MSKPEILLANFKIIIGRKKAQASNSKMTKLKEKDKTFKATGAWVKEKSYLIDKEKRTFSFTMADAKGIELQVVYPGTMPNNFETATSVVVTGNYKNGYFHAKEILTKCPSKYEEKYKDEKVKTSSL